MKKEYKKPELLFDSFELSDNIAYGCVKKATGPQDFAGITYFTTKFSCSPPEAGSDSDVGLCYHVPNEAVKIFPS